MGWTYRTAVSKSGRIYPEFTELGDNELPDGVGSYPTRQSAVAAYRAQRKELGPKVKRPRRRESWYRG